MKIGRNIRKIVSTPAELPMPMKLPVPKPTEQEPVPVAPVKEPTKV